MYAYLIDPFDREICRVGASQGFDINVIYKLLDCELIDHCCHQENGDYIFVDDEGLYKEHQKFFFMKNNQPLAGKGLWVGSDEEGNSCSPKTQIEEVRNLVQFVNFPLELVL